MTPSFNDEPRQRVWREKHASGKWVEMSLDFAPKKRKYPHEIAQEDKDESVVDDIESVDESEPLDAQPEKPTARARSKRGPSRLSPAERKARQRAREQLRAEIAQLTPDQQLIAQVVDRKSYLVALLRLAERDRRRQDDIVEVRLRLVTDEASRWASSGVETTRIVAQCFEADQRRGSGARPRSRLRHRLRESDVLTVIEGDAMFSEPMQALTLTAAESVS